MSKYEFKEIADISVSLLKKGINIERKFITKAHTFHDKIYAWDNVLAHLDEKIPAKNKHAHKLLGKIIDGLMEIREIIESYEYKEIHIIQKEIIGVSKKQWNIVKKLEKTETQLEEKELEEIHNRFKILFNLMSEHRVIKALQKDFATKKEIEEYTKEEHYYLSQIFKFVSTYEKILSDIINT
jgi:Mg2+ and Co2+ transporter CorA